MGDLFLRQQLAPRVIQTNFLGNTVGCRLTVAGQHGQIVQSQLPQGADGLLRVGLQRIAQADAAQVLAVIGHVYRRCTGGLRGDGYTVQQLRLAHQRRLAVQHRTDTVAGDLLDPRQTTAVHRLTVSLQDGFCQGMGGLALAISGDLQQLLLTDAICAGHLRNGELALSQRAGLIEGRDLRLGQ